MRPSVRRSAVAQSVVSVVVLTFLVLSALPALGHGGGAGVVPVLDPLPPELPESVEVRVVATQVSSLLEVTNPTGEVLEVQQADGTPWLRIGAGGVEVASGAVDTYATTNPTGGSVPRDVLDGSRDNEWVRVSDEPTWSWFEHRMHPEGVVPAQGAVGEEGTRRLLDWEVPLRYAAQDLVLRGGLELRPPTGAIGVELTSEVPAGVTVQALAGGIPGLLLGLDGAEEAVVVGLSGEDYLRYSASGVAVDVASPTHRAVEAARGNALPPLPGPTGADWQQVSATPTHAWLETRARPPIDLPVAVREGGEVVDLLTWQVPVRIDGELVVLTGVTRWLPLEEVGRGAVGDGAGVRWPWLVGAGVIALAAAGLVLWRRRAV